MSTMCEHTWMKIGNFERQLKIEDLHVHQESSSYSFKEKRLTISVDVIGGKSPIKGLNLNSTSIREAEQKQLVQVDVGKIDGNKLNMDIMICTKCTQQLPPQEFISASLKFDDRQFLSGIKTLYLQ